LLVVVGFVWALKLAWTSVTIIFGLCWSIIGFGAGMAESIPLDSFFNLLCKVLWGALALGGALLIVGWIILAFAVVYYPIRILWGVIWPEPYSEMESGGL